MCVKARVRAVDVRTMPLQFDRNSGIRARCRRNNLRND
jgi:hypothetical protein